MREKRFSAILFVLTASFPLSLPSSLFAVEAPAVRATVSPTSGKLGDLITLDIEVDHSLSLVVDAPVFAKSLGAFEIFASTRQPVTINGDRAIDRFQAQLQAFTTGQHPVPALEVPYKDAMGKVFIVKTPELSVLIEEVPPGPKDKGDIRGIKGAVGPVAWSPWWWVVAVILLCAVCFFFWRKRRLEQIGPPPPPPVPADEEALEKLRALEASGLLAAGRLKEFFSGVSDILRAYLEAGFSVPALERTTSELMRDLRKRSPVPAERQIELQSILETCDLVKFAKWKPPVEEGQALWAAGVKFVEQTKPLLPAQGREKAGDEGRSALTPTLSHPANSAGQERGRKP